jgi:predicted PurR-regulated permease PerM
MIRSQLIAVLMGAILAGLSTPLYRRLLRLLRNRNTIAASLTVILLLLVIVIPSLVLIGIVATQAVNVSESIGPWLEQQASRSDELDEFVTRLPFAEKLEPYREQITAKLAELTGTLGRFIVNVLASATRGTASFFLSLFISIYATFFFLKYGQGTLDRILYYLPLKDEDENRLVDRFMSVARATLKGTLVIALVQGALGAAGLALMGVGGAVFWGAVIAVLSLIPVLGASLIWVPVTIYLVAVGRIGSAVFIVIWFNAVVGTSDNILRPILVGKDTEMSDLLVLVSTLGGLATFGVSGIVIGPILAAIFDTTWAIYGESFKGLLPARGSSVPEE